MQVLLPALALPLQVVVQVLLDWASAGVATCNKRTKTNPAERYFKCFPRLVVSSNNTTLTGLTLLPQFIFQVLGPRRCLTRLHTIA